MVDSFLFFLAYNSLRQARLRLRKSKDHLPVLEELGVGFVAGALSRFCTTPVANIVTRLQTASMVSSRSSGNSSGPHKATMSSIAAEIRAEKGIQGFWSGYSASLILTLNPSLTFFFFETLKRLSLPQSRRENPPASATFFLAAMSKALASSITYPFSLAKSRAQVSSRSVDTHENEDEETKEKRLKDKSIPAKTGQKAVRRTVFTTILEIVRSEGVAALYEGLSGEVVKGFFNHGITMLMKEVVHKLIVPLYFAVLRLLRKSPEAGELVDRVQHTAHEAKEQVRDGVQSVKENANAAVSQLDSAIKDTVDGTEKGKLEKKE